MMPVESRSAKMAGTPPPLPPFGSGKARATSWPMMMPPSAGDTTASMVASEKSAASARPSFSAERGYCKTSAHCTYVPLCRPLVSSKWPCRMAPEASNMRSNSSSCNISPRQSREAARLTAGACKRRTVSSLAAVVARCQPMQAPARLPDSRGRPPLPSTACI